MRPLTHDILDRAIDDLYTVADTTSTHEMIEAAGLDPDAIILAAHRAVTEGEQEGAQFEARDAFILGAVVASYAQLTATRPRTSRRRRGCG